VISYVAKVKNKIVGSVFFLTVDFKNIIIMNFKFFDRVSFLSLNLGVFISAEKGPSLGFSFFVPTSKMGVRHTDL